MKARLFLIFVVIFPTVFAERDSDCRTPNGENVKCIPTRKCKVILDAIQTENSTAIDFAKESQCGYDSEPLVCYGSTGYPSIQPDIHDTFTKAPEIDNKHGTGDAKKETKAVILLNFNAKALPNRTVCGLEATQYRVVGGERTEIDQFPWMAALEYKSKITNEPPGIRCGGTLINIRYVMTAAHCIVNREFKLIKVWLGDWNINEDPDCIPTGAHIICAAPVQKIDIKTEIPHVFYSRRSNNNDIGLLRLEHDVKYTGTSSDIKLKDAVPILPNSKCQDILDTGRVSDNQLCAGGERGKDSCQGDSGGPLMRTFEDKVSHQAQWYQEGVVSYGVGCGRARYPSIYTRVIRYTHWVINNIGID